eukprot:3248452-Karenia_brevis.AAC.1
MIDGRQAPSRARTSASIFLLQILTVMNGHQQTAVETGSEQRLSLILPAHFDRHMAIDRPMTSKED